MKNLPASNFDKKRSQKICARLMILMYELAVTGHLDQEALNSELALNYRPEDLLTTDQAAKILKVSPKTLANKRSKGEGPPFVNPLGKRAIRYEYKALMHYAKSGARMSTSEVLTKEGGHVRKEEPKPSSGKIPSGKATSTKKKSSTRKSANGKRKVRKKRRSADKT